ncbi:MAG: hypothetical protein M3O31_17355 [Acidobacteriota bacterium]|nr:hypothetical protein [Acidobacteriota bacterium]
MNCQFSSFSEFVVNVLAVLVVLAMLLCTAPSARCQTAAVTRDINSLGGVVSVPGAIT